MKDILLFLSAIFLGYICFASAGLFLGQLFFPFLSKEELKKRKMELKRQKTLIPKR